jgi:hypothetical protein
VIESRLQGVFVVQETMRALESFVRRANSLFPSAHQTTAPASRNAPSAPRGGIAAFFRAAAAREQPRGEAKTEKIAKATGVSAAGREDEDRAGGANACAVEADNSVMLVECDGSRNGVNMGACADGECFEGTFECAAVKVLEVLDGTDCVKDRMVNEETPEALADVECYRQHSEVDSYDQVADPEARKNDVEKLVRILREVNQDRASLRAEVGHLQAERDTLRRSEIELTAENSRLRARIATLLNEQPDLQHDVSAPCEV